MKKMVRWAFIAVAVSLAVTQLFRPPRESVPESAPDDFVVLYRPPAEVEKILRTGCYDCHSSATRYPWYAEIQPVGWWLNDHINDAKAELNFSEFGSYRIRRKYRKLEEMITQVEKGEMPLSSYQWMHPDAKLTAAQKELFLDWVGSLRETIKANTPPDSLARPKPGS